MEAKASNACRYCGEPAEHPVYLPVGGRTLRLCGATCLDAALELANATSARIANSHALVKSIHSRSSHVTQRAQGRQMLDCLRGPWLIRYRKLRELLVT